MDWKIHEDGYFLCLDKGYRFEVGEWKHGTWLLKICGIKEYVCEDLQEAFDIARNFLLDTD